MVLDAVRGYLQLASGLTEVTRQRATASAKALLASAGADQLLSGGVGQVAMDQAARGQAAMGQVAALADEIVATGKANRELLVGLVRAEVDRAVTGLGLVSRDDFEALQRSVDRLAAHQAHSKTPAPAAGKPAKKAAKKPTKKAAKKTAKAPTKKATQ
jgi:hypothetical protein